MSCGKVEVSSDVPDADVPRPAKDDIGCSGAGRN
jgi:hypothetical protein